MKKYEGIQYKDEIFFSSANVCFRFNFGNVFSFCPD